MNNDNFSKWYPIPYLDGIYDIEGIKNINWLDIWFIPVKRKKVFSLNHKI